jgi:ABC-type uncharacterized transport system permease subunit
MAVHLPITTWHLVLAAVGLAYLTTAAAAAIWQVFRARAWGGPVVRVMVGHAVVANVVLLVWRAWAGGAGGAFRHSFESMVLFATLLSMLGLVSPAIGRLRGLHVLILPVAAVVQAACFASVGKEGVSFEYEPWFITHMASLILGATCFGVGGVAGMAYLLVDRRLHNGQGGIAGGQMPPLESLEQFGRRMTMIGFALLTFGILTGICGIAHTKDWLLFMGDPLVILTFLMWLLYGVALVVIGLKPQLRGRRAAWMAVWSFALLVFVFVLAGSFSRTH